MVNERVDRLKAGAVDETKKLFGIFAYLWVLLTLFSLYKAFIFDEDILTYQQGFALINALALAKIVIVGQAIHVRDDSKGISLVYPILSKSARFAVLLTLFHAIEETGIGVWGGKTVVEAVPTIGDGTLQELLMTAIIIFIALIPFFAFIELEQVVEPEGSHTRLFGRKASRVAGAAHVEKHFLNSEAVRVQSESCWNERLDRLKAGAVDETKKLFGVFAYLWALLTLFSLHKAFIFNEDILTYQQGFALINALALAKIVDVGQAIHVRDDSKGISLVYPSLSRSALFAVLLIVFHVIEETTIGVWRGKTVAEAVPTIGDGALEAILMTAIIIFIALIPFFAFIELEQVVGPEESHTFLFGRKASRVAGAAHVEKHFLNSEAVRVQSESGWRLIAKILRRHRCRVAGILLATLGVYASSLSIPIVIQNIIDGITSRQAVLFIGTLGILATMLSVADVFLADIRRSMVISLGQRVDRHISVEIMAHVLGARIDADRNTGEILNRTEQTNKIKTFMIDIIPSSIFDIGGAVIAEIMIFAYSYYCGLTILLIAGGGFLLSKNILDTFYTNVFSQFKLESERQGNLAETVGGLATIKALAMEPGRFRIWARKTKNLVNAYGNTSHILRRLFRITLMSQHLLTLAVVGVGGFEMMHGALSIGELFAILMLTDKVSSPLLSSADVARQCQEMAVAVNELGRLFDAPPECANVAAPLQTPLIGGIEFRNVIYRYSAKAIPAVAGLSLRLPEVGLVAIIGCNGSGKSTVLRLMLGLLRDFEGDIQVGGNDVRAYHPRWLRSQMAVVNQDTILFAGTIRENVASWTPGVSDAKIEAALHLAGAWEFVNEFPDKLDTHLTENAANLSGGQRQRLAVARAVLRDPKVILLDEPTAFLDVEAAVSLETRLRAWGRGRLMILVSHNLAATRTADTIILMEKGKVAAHGSHGELLNNSLLYRSLWNDYLHGADVPQSASGALRPNSDQPQEG